MVSFWNRITGNDMSADLKAYADRIAQLPADYQAAWATVQQVLMSGTAVRTTLSGRDLMPVFAGVCAFMEEAAADGLDAQAALGDPAAFAQAAASAEGVPTLLHHWGEKLTRDVHRKLGR